ncbi:GNAT family N-acetyltransferase [Cupriavidus pampae]|uniref:N-acetyltransferase domain-containing protein n=1 Tax=Cupriavidus pampae TaxID=659251 RepID=A0ABM8XUG2_9BURK|nr:GNAT family N-acetyltransferase [Cupriavidus pampae]CAG9183974.1 hypothetical protein LMG32289_05476 [Cupriavidus pampae]
MSRLKTLLSPWRWPPASPAAGPLRESAAITYQLVPASGQFRVYAMRADRQVGFCVASAFAPLEACFVYDLMVFAPTDRGAGIGAELLRQAWIHSGCETVAPVNIVPEAALWWAKRAQEGKIPVQLGLSTRYEAMLRYAAKDAVPPRDRAAQRRPGHQQVRTRGRLPRLEVKATHDHFRVVTAPSPVVRATLHNGAGEQVGTAAYGLSPLADRVYVFELRVAPEHQRGGYATALLCHLAREYGWPLTPVKALHAAHGFWQAAGQLADAGVVVTEPVWDLDAEVARWAHLRPLAERLEAQILERLYARHEPWAIAVGRGLDAPAPPSTPRVAHDNGPAPG